MTKTVVGSNLARNHGQELSFVLPLTEVSSFPVLFKKVDEFVLIHFHILFLKIEDDISVEGDLGISSYGVSMTTLEEVFLRIGEEEEFESEKSESDVNSETILLSDGEEVKVEVEEESQEEQEAFHPVAASDKSAWRQFKGSCNGMKVLKLSSKSA